LQYYLLDTALVFFLRGGTAAVLLRAGFMIALTALAVSEARA
jgi:hypothetical protein